jgi:hypothetical protein
MITLTKTQAAKKQTNEEKASVEKHVFRQRRRCTPRGQMSVRQRATTRGQQAQKRMVPAHEDMRGRVYLHDLREHGRAIVGFLPLGLGAGLARKKPESVSYESTCVGT